jgi:hypothetical protein
VTRITGDTGKSGGIPIPGIWRKVTSPINVSLIIVFSSQKSKIVLFVHPGIFSGRYLFGASQNPAGHGDDPSPVYDEMCRDKKAQSETGPVMDITHPCERQHQSGQSKHSHKKGKLEKSGNKTDQKKNAHPQIQKPPDNLHVHGNHTFRYTSPLHWKVMELTDPDTLCLVHFGVVQKNILPGELMLPRSIPDSLP